MDFEYFSLVFMQISSNLYILYVVFSKEIVMIYINCGRRRKRLWIAGAKSLAIKF